MKKLLNIFRVRKIKNPERYGTTERALKMKQCRVTAKKMLGDGYAERIKPYMEVVQLVMKANNTDAVNAVRKISEQKKLWKKKVNQVMYMAAAVEIIDPSTTQ